MGLKLLQASLFATLVILASGASVGPRSIPEAGQMRSGGGGGGGGGLGGGIGGGFGGGGGGGGGIDSSSGESQGGQLEGDNEESGDKGMGWGGGGGGGGSSDDSAEGQTDDEDSGDDDGEEDGSDDTGDDGGNGCNNDDTGNDGETDGDDDDEGTSDGGDDDGDGTDSDGTSNEGGASDDGEDDNDEGEGDGSSEDSCGSCGGGGGGGDGDGEGWGEGCGTKSTKSTDHQKRSIKSIKSPDMGESSIPSPIWLSPGKTAPRSYYWEYYNDNDLVSGGSGGGDSHRPPQDISTIVTVIPWVLAQFTRGLTLKMVPLATVPRSLVTKYGTAQSHALLRFKRDTDMMEAGESGESGAATNDAEVEETGDFEQEDSEAEMDENSESEEMETAEEGPSEVGINSEMTGEDISSASEDVDEGSHVEEGEMQQEEVEEGEERLDEASGTNEIQSAVMEKELEIAQEAMNPAMLDTLMVDHAATDSIRAQARAARSMERNGAEVVEDLTLALKSNLWSTGTPKRPGDGVVGEARTRGLDLGLGNLVELDKLLVGR